MSLWFELEISSPVSSKARQCANSRYAYDSMVDTPLRSLIACHYAKGTDSQCQTVGIQNASNADMIASFMHAPVLLLCWLHAFSIRFLSNHAKHASGSCLRPPSVKPLRTTRFTCRWPEKYLRKYYIYRYTNIEN